MIRRKSTRPEAALRWLAENGVQDVATENVLDVRMEGEMAVINLAGSIGKSWWDDSGITASEFDKELNAIPKGKKILLRINSEGGSIKEGLGIYDSIEARSADITARNVGYALSIASVFPLAASRIESPDHAIWMTHEGWMNASGNKRDMRKNAEMLESHDKAISGIYAKRTGKTVDFWNSKMEAESWFTGKEAIDAGLADVSGEPEKENSEMANQRPVFAEYLAKCKNIPAHIFNCLSALPPQGERKQPNQPQPKDQNMDRQQKIALLNSWGVNVKDETSLSNARIDELIAMGKTAALASFTEHANAMHPVAAGKKNDPLAELQARLDNERKARITAEIHRRAENKITNDKLEWWVTRAMEDEAGTYAQLEALPSAHVGSEPLGPGRVEGGNEITLAGWSGRKVLPEVENMFKGLPTQPKTVSGRVSEASARYDVLKENWGHLTAKALAMDKQWMDKHGTAPVAANTYSASLVTNFLITGAITQLSPKFAPLKAFARDNSVDPYKPLATGQMKFNTTVQDGSDVQTNETNWETDGHSDSTVNNVSISVNQYSAILHVTNSELNSGLRMEDLVVAKIASLGSKVTKVVTAPITAANFTATPIISAPAAFSFTELATLWGQLKKSSIKNVILDGEYLAKIINTPTLFQSVPVIPGAGWKNVNGWDFVGLNTEWSGAGANIRGFANNPQAIGVIAGLPLTPPEGIPGNTLMQSTLALPGVDISIQVNVWFSLATRTLYASYDLMLGASKIDGTAGVIIASGNPG